MKIVAATQNNGKIKEIKDVLKDVDIEIISPEDVNIFIDVVEDGSTFEENAFKKAAAYAKLTEYPVLADDSGLEVDYLDGAPGIYSARYAGEGASAKQRNEKLLRELKDVEFEKRTARFVCVIACIFPDGRKIQVRGECEGIITTEIKGTEGFGYDPVFLLPEYNKTMAELGSEIKNIISHRAKALQILKEKLIKVM